MNTELWNLFWTTGMPEAWLMSRGGERVPLSGEAQGGGQEGAGPLADSPAPPTASVPGSLRNPY